MIQLNLHMSVQCIHIPQADIHPRLEHIHARKQNDE